VSHPRAATALLLVIIAASAAAFLRAEQLKLRHSPVGHPHVRTAFSPGCSDPGCTRVARLGFTLRDAQHLQIAIVRPDGAVVRVLADRDVAKGPVHIPWDGSTTNGAVAPDGKYRLRVTLASGREVTIPDPIVVDTKPAGITLGAVRVGRSTVAIHYTRSESNVHAELYVFQHGRLVIHKRHVIPRVAHFRLDAPGLRPGRATIEIVAVDGAGNRTPSPPTATVTIP
jgi:FlgD Ig-like domain